MMVKLSGPGQLLDVAGLHGLPGKSLKPLWENAMLLT